MASYGKKAFVAFLLLTVIVAGWCQAAEKEGSRPTKTKLVTITLNKAPLRTALELLSKHGLNYLAAEDVLESAAPVTARFRNVPVMDAAKAIVTTCGLCYVIESPAKMRVRTLISQ